MKDFSSIIDKIGVATLAKILSVDESHVRTMKARDSIPPEYWGQVLEIAPKYELRGLSYAALRKLRTARFNKEPERAA